MALGGAAAAGAGAAAASGKADSTAEPAAEEQQPDVASAAADSEEQTPQAEQVAASESPAAAKQDEPKPEPAPEPEPEPRGPQAPAKALKVVQKFVAAHGGAANVVIQPVGRLGVRFTLVGEDGTLGDQMVRNLGEAHALRDAVAELTEDSWSQKIVSKVDLPSGHWQKMAGSGRLV